MERRNATLVPMTQMIDVLVTEPDGSARIETIDGKWQTIKALLHDGWLEAVSGITGEWIAYGDEEGNLKGLQPNGLAAGIIMAMNGAPVAPVGTVVFTGQRWISPEDGYGEASIPESMRNLVFPLGE